MGELYSCGLECQPFVDNLINSCHYSLNINGGGMRKEQVMKYFESKYGSDAVRAVCWACRTRGRPISRQAVHKWPEVVPIKQAWKLERASGGKLSMRLSDYR